MSRLLQRLVWTTIARNPFNTVRAQTGNDVIAFHLLRTQPAFFTKYQTFRTKGGFAFDDEFSDEEVDYGITDDNLEELRVQHREHAKKEHSVDDSFDAYDIHIVLKQRLQKLGYTTPFQIQSRTLASTLEGRDIMAKAITGSGKTLAFSIPIVHKILTKYEENVEGFRKRQSSPLAIVLSPTRELCLQIYRSIEELDSRIRCVAVYGGESMERQESRMRRGMDVVCATPGRLRDFIARGRIRLHNLEFLCLDEGDELLTPNFREQLIDVLEHSPANKQVMLFSATIPREVKTIAANYMKDPAIVDVTDQATPKRIRHLLMGVSPRDYMRAIAALVTEHNAQRVIVFMKTKMDTARAAMSLRKRYHLKAEVLNSDLSQNRREIVMAAFRQGKIKILVATDVAARGLDVPEVDLVIQAGTPKNGADYYIHRAGRTARGGREGLAVMFHNGDKTDRNIVDEIAEEVTFETVAPPDGINEVEWQTFYGGGGGKKQNRYHEVEDWETQFSGNRMSYTKSAGGFREGLPSSRSWGRRGQSLHNRYRTRDSNYMPNAGRNKFRNRDDDDF